MAGKKLKNKIVKINDSEDLYSHFGEKTDKPDGFIEALSCTDIESDLEKAVAGKTSGPGQKQPVSELISFYPPPQSELDLHGLTADSAERRIRTFLWESVSDKMKTVRIITGKGLHSEGPAILPDVTEIVLEEMKSSGIILHYQWEKKVKLKSGALIVYTT